MIGWARGGRPTRLAQISLRWFPLLVLGAALLLAAPHAWASPTAERLLVGAGYLAALAMLLANAGRPWLLVVLAGVALNAAVIVANGGRMPVSLRALEAAGRPAAGALVAGTDARHVLASPGSPFTPLGDRLGFHVGTLAGVVSPGDVVLAVGVAGFVQGAMVGRRRA